MKIAAFLLAGAAAIWAAWVYVLHPDVTLNYRLTAEVQMRDRTYTGSAVIETRWSETLVNPLGLADDWTVRERGEAVVVDMAEDGVVLVTLAGYTQQQPRLLPQGVFGTDIGTRTLREYLQGISRDQRVIQVKPDAVPVVIWLKDRLDPSSAICIEPDGAQDGVATPSFPRVQMRMVHEPATEGIYAVLPWLRPLLEPTPYGRGSLEFIDLRRRFPQRVCYCAPRDLKRNGF